MAYGKIKADTFVYDNSGSDAEVTLASLGNKANLPASAGTVAASEVVQVDANKDITGFRNVTLSGDLTVNGTTTTINSTTLSVDDKNIELGTVDTPSDTTADGGGITLKGATDKTITWVNSTDSWDFNQNINVNAANLNVVNPANAGEARLLLKAGQTGEALILFNADAGDNQSDKWKITAPDGGPLSIQYDDGSWENALTATKDGAVTLYHDNSAKLATSAAGVTVTGSVTDSKGDVRNIPISQKTSAYVLVAADAGKAIHITTGGVTVNNSVFSAGNAVTIINDSGSDQTITQGSGLTIHNSADAATGNRTLAGRGMATIWFADSDKAYISGAGLS